MTISPTAMRECAATCWTRREHPDDTAAPCYAHGRVRTGAECSAVLEEMPETVVLIDHLAEQASRRTPAHMRAAVMLRSVGPLCGKHA